MNRDDVMSKEVPPLSPLPPPPPEILMSTVFPLIAKVFPDPMKFKVVTSKNLNLNDWII